MIIIICIVIWNKETIGRNEQLDFVQSVVLLAQKQNEIVYSAWFSSWAFEIVRNVVEAARDGEDSDICFSKFSLGNKEKG